MSNAILVIGESGTGKSTAIRTLPPKETFIVNVLNKPLPFKGGSKNYTKVDGEKGNYYATDSHAKIIRTLNYVNNKRPDIKYLVLDDFGYSISNDFMRKALVKGYEKFSELGKDAWEVLALTTRLRDDLTIFVVMHSSMDEMGHYKPKTIGKMLDEKVCVEGMFTIVLHSLLEDGQYCLLTNNDGCHMAKSPLDMFSEMKIENDFKMVADQVNEYFNDDVNTSE